jgi:lysozyme family protein
MAAGNFAESLRRVGISEGGFSNDPDDPGGVTLNGITQRVYDADRRRRGLALKSLTPEMNGNRGWIAERDQIYRFQFWDTVRGDELPAGVDYVVFDGGVNSGPVQSVKWLQRALASDGLYHGAIDGHIGRGTLDALEHCPDYDRLVALICQYRLAFMRTLKTWWKYGDGWKKRVARVLEVGQAWASGSVGPEPAPTRNGYQKARIADARKPPSAAVGDLATGTGMASGTGAGAIQAASSASGVKDTLQQAQDALTPLSSSNSIVSNIVLVLVIIGAVLTIGGLAWRFYANYRRAKMVEALDLGVAVPI